MKPLCNLNHLEVAALTRRVFERIEGGTIERLFIPSRPAFPGGFIRGEFVLQIRSQRYSVQLLWVQMRPQHAIFWLSTGQKMKVAPDSTQSVFHQFLNRELSGSRIRGMRSLPNDRVVEFQFSDNRALVLVMIPARPELIFGVKQSDLQLEVLSSSNKKYNASSLWNYPTPSANLPDFKVRDCLFGSGLSGLIESELKNESLILRLRKVIQLIRLNELDQLKRKRDSQKSIELSEQENPYQEWGEILKSHLGAHLSLEKKGWNLLNYSTGQIVHIPCDPALNLPAQVERFFHLARRTDRRLAEARSRLEEAESRLNLYRQFTLKEADIVEGSNIEPEIRAWEQRLGLVSEKGVERKTNRKMDLGREFLSQDGYVIVAGRNSAENLDLTFKKAKGNDVWLHVRGKRSAHVIICIPPGKSAPLNTLLDAAQICLVVSGGREWGKTEIDYTFRKNVKRIKNSTEVSYTQNKTLLVDPDPERIKKLFISEEKESRG